MIARRHIARGLVAIALAALAFSAPGADLSKTLRVAYPIAETGFDPQAAGDVYSNYVNRVIFDTLYSYDYLARPFKIVPNTAVAMPEISADGKTWTIKIRPGIYFAVDPVFKGAKRELTAADYVYSWKRVLDPRLRSISVQVFDSRLVGAEAVIAAARASGKFDYDASIEGLQAVDRYTIRIRLNFPSYESARRSHHDGNRGGRARGHRVLWRCQRLGNGQSGGHGALSPERMAARAEDRSRGESDLP